MTLILLLKLKKAYDMFNDMCVQANQPPGDTRPKMKGLQNQKVWTHKIKGLASTDLKVKNCVTSTLTVGVVIFL